MVDCTSYAVDRLNELDTGEGGGGGPTTPDAPSPMGWIPVPNAGGRIHGRDGWISVQV